MLFIPQNTPIRKRIKHFVFALAFFLPWTGTVAQEPFRILDYSPAPGQFIDYTQFLYPGQGAQELTAAQVCHILDSLYHEASFMYIASLGGFGGSITLKLDKPISNQEGADFKVLGNAFYDAAHTPQLSDTPGGSSEPGIIWVSRDENGNGIADDPWYEIAGSEHHHPQTVSDYALTYYFDPENPSADIAYKSSTGDTGAIFRTSFHTQKTYFPLWLSSDSLTFRGRKLPPNARLIENNGRNQWLMLCYSYGYADNQPNTSPACGIDLDWAVDANGEPVVLDQIDFIKVVCATNQQPDLSIGEISTEFAGILALHADHTGLETVKNGTGMKVFPNPCQDRIRVQLPSSSRTEWLYALDLSGRCLLRVGVSAGQSGIELETSSWQPGVYLLRFAGETAKLVKL